jgi:hypothetical protein
MTSASCFRSISLGRLTQRLECHPHTVEVAGSNPAPPIGLTSSPDTGIQFSFRNQSQDRGLNSQGGLLTRLEDHPWPVPPPELSKAWMAANPPSIVLRRLPFSVALSAVQCQPGRRANLVWSPGFGLPAINAGSSNPRVQASVAGSDAIGVCTELAQTSRLRSVSTTARSGVAGYCCKMVALVRTSEGIFGNRRIDYNGLSLEGSN